MSNSGRTQQPGGRGGRRNSMANQVQEIAAAWRGEKLKTRVSLESVDLSPEQLDGIRVVISGRSLTFRGWSLPFFLRPGTHTATIDVEGLDLGGAEPELADPTVVAGVAVSLVVEDTSEE